MIESSKRTLAKTVTWRILAIVITYTLLFALTGNHTDSILYTIIIHMVKTLVYYIHERLWNRWNWERLEEADE